MKPIANQLPRRQAWLRGLVALGTALLVFASVRVHAQTAPMEGFLAVTAGARHSCAIVAGGGVRCWGDNQRYHQLGDGSNAALRTTPAAVMGLSSGVVALALGYEHSCALNEAGGVSCWGRNHDGQTGSPSEVSPQVPVVVNGLTSGASALAAGQLHTCALTTAGGVKCWGNNGIGQLGNNLVSATHTPTDVATLTSGVLAIAAGSVHSCAVTSAGGVKCWGANDHGQLGHGGPSGYMPSEVTGLSSGVLALALGGNHSCALLASGGVSCWGANDRGQLGDNTTTTRSTPAPVLGLSGRVKSIASAPEFSCALTVDERVWCWGGNEYGQLGDGRFATHLSATEVIGLAGGVKAITAGYEHACALLNSGQVRCWGHNYVGQLGDHSTLSRLSPVAVLGLASGQKAVSAGIRSCALSDGGGVQCWGKWVGDGTDFQRLAPVAVSGLGSGVKAIVGTGWHTCALTVANGAVCWGSNSSGQLGDGTTNPGLAPVNVSGLSSGVAALAAGSAHSCALTTGEAVLCWGDNRYGQLGNGGTDPSSVPVPVDGLSSGVVAISAMGDHSCALFGDGRMKCWGRYETGAISSPSSKLALSVGDRHVCNVYRASWGTDLGISCVGDTSQGQDMSIAPEDNGPSPLVVAAGGEFTCVLREGRDVRCQGANDAGRLGSGTSTSRSSPGLVTGLSGPPIALATGEAHACAVTAGGAVQCWGGNGGGQLGDGTAGMRSIPAPVLASVPDAPAVASVVAGPASAVIALSAKHDGGLAIDGFRLTCNPGAIVATGTSSPLTVNGLTNGVSYTCTAAAHNHLGWSAESAPSPSFMPSIATPPSPPRNVVATPYDRQIVVSFDPPAAFGTRADGSPAAMVSYSATCGSRTVADLGSPIAVGGLTNGVSYTCTVVAFNDAALASAASSPSNSATPTGSPVLTSYSSASATGTGSISAGFTGGGSTCSFSKSRFIPTTGDVASPPAGSAPPGVVFPHGLFDFVLSGCVAGSTVNFTITYPLPLPPGTTYWKYGPTSGNPAPHWYVLPATVLGNQVSFALTDGGLGDDDLSANGSIVDQGGPGNAGASVIPTLPARSLLLLALALSLLGAWRLRSVGRRARIR